MVIVRQAIEFAVNKELILQDQCRFGLGHRLNEKKALSLALFLLVLERFGRRRFGVAFFIFFIDHMPNVFDRFPLIVSGDRFSGDLQADAAFGRMIIPDDRAVFFSFIDKAVITVLMAS